MAANEAYRDNWDRLFGGPAPWEVRRWQAQYCQEIRDLLLQDPDIAESVLDELGYEKKKAEPPKGDPA